MLKKEKIQKLTSERVGFSMVEIMVIVTLITILAGVGVIAFRGVQARARDAKRQTDLESIQTALEVYYQEHYSYPSSSEWDKVKNNGVSDDVLSVTLEPDYMNLVPIDPLQSDTANQGPCGGGRYGYVYWSDGTTYFLATYVEGANSSPCSSLAGWTACGGSPPSDCYGVQNP